MTITELKLSIRDLVQDYSEDTSTSQVIAWGGKLDVRPEYQREFVYDEAQRDAVIQTVINGFPLNTMYFVKREDNTYEVLDGQQRIISIGRYYKNAFSVKLPVVGGFNMLNFPNLYENQTRAFLEYHLTVYICEGTDEEKFAWFQVINIAGETLEKQEILNALYHSAWLTSAKSLFSRVNCAAHRIYGRYMSGSHIRQKYLETVFAWKADAEGINCRESVAEYMKKHRQDANAEELWQYFESVFNWVQRIFGRDSNTSMCGVPWGFLYNAHKDDNLDAESIQKQVADLLANDEVTRKSGIYEYILTGKEKFLNLRRFSRNAAISLYNQQEGKCKMCGRNFDFADMQADHILPWSAGGRTELSNGQMLCIECNLKKSNRRTS